MSIALLDADMICYRAAVAAQSNIDWGDGAEGLTVDRTAAISNAKSMARTWHQRAGTERALLCFSSEDGENFRYQIGPEYKRSRGAKPEVYWTLVYELSMLYDTKSLQSLEADDVMGILQTSEKVEGTVIVSGDKDMKTVPGLLMDPLKDWKKPRRVRPDEAHAFWMYQTLRGDPVDGYGGCPGVGEQNAQAILDAPHLIEAHQHRITRGKRKGQIDIKWKRGDACSLWASIVSYYAKAGLTEADAIRQARFARILRREDYDKEKGQVRLWHPNRRKYSYLQCSGTP